MQDTTDWSQIFRDITAYGATRIFDPNAGMKLYQSNTNTVISPDGLQYTIGKPGETGSAAAASSHNVGVVIPSGLVLIGAFVLVYVLAKG
jgi:hypothetical protein